MGKHLKKYNTGGQSAESTRGGFRMKPKTGGTVKEITDGGGRKKRQLEEEDVHLVSSSYLQLRSRTVVIGTTKGEKRTRKSDYSVERRSCTGDGVERNRVLLSRCSSNSTGDFQTTEEERYLSRSGDHNKESKGNEEYSDFESTSCDLRDHHCKSGGEEEEEEEEEEVTRRIEHWTSSSDQEENCSRKEEAEEEEEDELDNLETTGRGTKSLCGSSSSIPSNTAGRNTRMLRLSSKMPSPTEIEEFFTAAENVQNNRFMKKYNYDLVNDVPVEGRYKWVKLNP